MRGERQRGQLRDFRSEVDGDSPSHEEFMQNLGTAGAAIKDALVKTVQCGVRANRKGKEKTTGEARNGCV